MRFLFETGLLLCMAKLGLKVYIWKPATWGDFKKLLGQDSAEIFTVIVV